MGWSYAGDGAEDAYIKGSLNGIDFFDIEAWPQIQRIGPNLYAVYRFTNPITTRFFHWNCHRAAGYWVIFNGEIYGYPAG
jgi:hypothetical protein